MACNLLFLWYDYVENLLPLSQNNFTLVLLVSSGSLPYNYGRSIKEAQYICYILKYVTKQKFLESYLED